MRVLDLFSGIGGFSLGLERAGMQTVGFCEIDPFCRQVLAKHWPETWIHDDVRTLTTPLIRERCGTVDLIAGGFPCQDISAAGKGAGLAGERSGLWWELCGLIARIRPRWLLIENVPVLRTRGADRVIACLEGIGYSVWPLVVGAWAVGAPHKRDRVWIVGRLVDTHECGRGLDQPKREPQGGTAVGWTGPAVAHADSKRAGEPEPAIGTITRGDARADAGGSGGRLGDTMCDGLRISGRAAAEVALQRRDATLWPARPGEPQHDWEEPRLVEFPVGGELDGVPVRLVRRGNKLALKAYGNSVVPQVVEVIGRAIMEAEHA